MSEERFTVVELVDEYRFVMHDSEAPGVEVGEESYVDVEGAAGRERVFFHTGVSPDYGGLGLASQLVRFVLDDAVTKGLRIVPVCPYVKQWLEKHPGEYAEHLTGAQANHLRAITEQQRA